MLDCSASASWLCVWRLSLLMWKKEVDHELVVQRQQEMAWCRWWEAALWRRWQSWSQVKEDRRGRWKSGQPNTTLSTREGASKLPVHIAAVQVNYNHGGKRPEGHCGQLDEDICSVCSRSHKRSNKMLGQRKNGWENMETMIMLLRQVSIVSSCMLCVEVSSSSLWHGNLQVLGGGIWSGQSS